MNKTELLAKKVIKCYPNLRMTFIPSQEQNEPGLSYITQIDDDDAIHGFIIIGMAGDKYRAVYEPTELSEIELEAKDFTGTEIEVFAFCDKILSEQ